MAKKRVIVIDDEEEVLSLLKDSLTGFGFDVMVCQDSKYAWYGIKTFNPDLILLDILMPNIGGFQICEMLNNDPQIRGIPIIIISGFGDLIDLKRAYQLGVVGYLVKPFTLNDLSKEVSKAISNKEKSL